MSMLQTPLALLQNILSAALAVTRGQLIIFGRNHWLRCTAFRITNTRAASVQKRLPSSLTEGCRTDEGGVFDAQVGRHVAGNGFLRRQVFFYSLHLLRLARARFGKISSTSTNALLPSHVLQDDRRTISGTLMLCTMMATHARPLSTSACEVAGSASA
ncbi:hypothetical protein K469DRAFT_685892 [Zopfia rhizophila CBS 207.26]|uniref:Secreted protein n=1 Tax=Zopfia rhizophila CBS 207.26 TaxID=1314779 RepID=A0A6A6EC32_9PEZI|nr:hypothetical protein K469DRAFT_685892 [Zopfia rhizophila CBS 207.26]